MAQYSIALLSWREDTFEVAVREAAQAGFRACELFQSGVGLEDDQAVGDARRLLNAHSLHALTIHTSGGRVSATDEDERAAAVERVTAAFEGFAALGGFAAIVHPSHALRPGERPDDQVEAFRRSLPALYERADAAGIRLAFENLPVKGDGLPRPLGRMQDLRAALEGMPAEVGICLDTGHAVLNGLSPADEARDAGERLIALHLHDSDEVSDHWIPGDRSIVWAALNGALIEIGFHGAWTFEVVRASDAEGALPAAIRSRAVADAWTAGRFG